MALLKTAKQSRTSTNKIKASNRRLSMVKYKIQNKKTKYKIHPLLPMVKYLPV